MAHDLWITLEEASRLNGRTGEALSKRVEMGKIRSKRRFLAPLTRVYSREDAERDKLVEGTVEAESDHDRWTRKLSRDTPS